jgi:hypothetical protein
MYPVSVEQYNTQKTQNNTYTLKTIHNTFIPEITRIVSGNDSNRGSTYFTKI